MLSLLLGLVGSGYFLYGKKQSDIWFMLAGGLLVFFPYLVSSIGPMLLIGAALAAAPFVLQRLDWP
jgi:hypothetical protein